MRCSVESNIKNMPKDMAFYHLQKNMEINMVKTNGYCNKDRNGCFKNCF